MSHHEALKTGGDLTASAASTLVIVSHWSQVVTPIIALLVGLMTLAWWTVRLWDRFKAGREGAGS